MEDDAADTGQRTRGQAKRQRTSSMYQRKRAVAACETCRHRKTKCDNVRPVCGFCQRSGAHCVYGTGDYSTFDPASLAILDRVNYAVSLLETQTTPVADLSTLPQRTATASKDHQQHPAAVVSETGDNTTGQIWPLYTPDFPSGVQSCESILKWPVFADIIHCPRSLVLEGQEDDSLVQIEAERPSALGRGVQEDDLIPLSKKFLAFVHVKNPILDVADFNAAVRHAAENGPAWDGQSCLVLIACALACLSAPFDTSEDTISTPATTNSSRMSCIDKGAASLYYLAAKKRLGLLRPSLLYIQCLFLCGVYEMYCLSPVQAWFYFNRACLDFRNIVSLQNPKQDPFSDEAGGKSRRLEQRLYWSCMKSEYEIRCEIPLPLSDITHCEYPEMLPSPPAELTSPASQQHSLDVGDDDIVPDEEKSWFYYLADISNRTMMNRALAVMGRPGERGRVRDIPEAMKHCAELNEQIDIWYSHIPPQIDLGNNILSRDELAHFVNNRALACREWIHRPFVYYIIHQLPGDPHFAEALPLARKCLELCIEHMFRTFPHHRHHGTWYVARASMTRALILLAAAKSGKIQLPQGSKEAVMQAHRTLERWSGEAPDLKRALDILEELERYAWDGEVDE